MGHLVSLQTHQFRNLCALELELGSQFNLFVGENAAGKTSILEAIYFLGLGKSFRSHQVHHVVQTGCNTFSIFGIIAEEEAGRYRIGIEKQAQGQTKMKINEQPVMAASELVSILPIFLMNADTFDLIDADPQWRRNFLDGGLFHVERTFISAWKRMRRALLQRNAALREIQPQDISVWDKEFIKAGEEVTQARKVYFEKFTGVLRQVLAHLIEFKELKLVYRQGWGEEKTLAEALLSAYEHDTRRGFTQYGPHRSDIEIKVHNKPAASILSRGEKKLLVCAMKLAQGVLLREWANKRGVYLVDDLPAELDTHHQKAVIETLAGLSAQVYITGTEVRAFDFLRERYPANLFHVERGRVLLPA